MFLENRLIYAAIPEGRHYPDDPTRVYLCSDDTLVYEQVRRPWAVRETPMITGHFFFKYLMGHGLDCPMKAMSLYGAATTTPSLGLR